MTVRALSLVFFVVGKPAVLKLAFRWSIGGAHNSLSYKFVYSRKLWWRT
jgi:hypothetical protein